MVMTVAALLVVAADCAAWQLTLLHVNDIHVRMEETNKFSADCRQAAHTEVQQPRHSSS